MKPRYFPQHEGPGVTPFGIWLACWAVRITPFVLLLPVRCKWKNCHGAELTFRRLRRDQIHPFKPINFGDWYIPWDAPRLVLWRKKWRHHTKKLPLPLK